MNLGSVDLNLLVALDALLETEHVTRAGERLHLSQSAMSGALYRLRAHFEDPLLVPVGRRMQRTLLGHQLQRPVRGLLQQAEAILKTRPVFDPSTSDRVFKVMASDYGANVVVAETLRRVAQMAPGIAIEIIPFSDSPSRSLEQGDIDLLIIDKIYVSPAHPYVTLFEDSFVVVADKANEALPENMSLDTFLQCGHVVVKYGDKSISHIAEKYLLEGGHVRRIEITVSGFSAVAQFIVGTRRIAVMHRMLATNYAAMMPIRILKLPIDLPSIQECLQWHTYRQDDPGGEWLRNQIRKTADEAGGARAAGRR